MYEHTYCNGAFNPNPRTHVKCLQLLVDPIESSCIDQSIDRTVFKLISLTLETSTGERPCKGGRCWEGGPLPTSTRVKGVEWSRPIHWTSTPRGGREGGVGE